MVDAIYEERPWLKHYPPGIPAEKEIPVRSLGDAFDEATERFRDRTAAVFYGKRITYGELKDKVDRFANALSHLGIKRGDRVALLLLNSPEHIIAFYGVIKLGAIVSSVSPVYVSDEIRHQLTDGGVESIVCQDMLWEKVEMTGLPFKNVILTNISESLPRIKKMFGKSILRSVYQKMSVPSAKLFQREGFHSFQDLLKSFPPIAPKVEVNPKVDVATLQYTGGTTGLPKGVMTTHYAALAEDISYYAYYDFLDDGKEVLVSYMPLYHAAGQSTVLIHGLLHGMTHVILTTPELDDILNSMVQYKATFFFGSPAIYEILKDYEKTERVDWKSLKILISGADALLESTALEWKERYGVPIHQIYGMTETVFCTHANPRNTGKQASVGIPITNTLSAILDPDEDKYLPPGEMGEVALSGPQVTIGYWNNPRATKDCETVINGVKWLRTGDLGRMDDDGYFYLYDRKRDLIKYKGLRVYAREVEEVLKTHPQIKEVGVIGERDPKVGENVKAMVVLETDARGKLSEADIIAYCDGKLASYKIPKIIQFLGEIPKTDVGKVSRRELREEER